MRRIIETELIKPAAPHEWAIASHNTLYSVHVPIRPDGSIENGDTEQQTEVTLSDLQVTLKAAGADLKDVVLIQIYLTSLEHNPIVDDVSKRFLEPPYPVRACIAFS